ncbi:hypothetical protein HK101_008278 [Irineochytrium annulatum]|nr:hypothetical protein HK101_008278 [Irineochytrium annulatum]
MADPIRLRLLYLQELAKRGPQIRGKYYERQVAMALQIFGFSLQVVGGANDKGVDIIGKWRPLPHPVGLEGKKSVRDVPRHLMPTTPIADALTVGSCKCHNKPLRPSYFREFEGVMTRYPNAVGVFASQNGFSDETRSDIWSSPHPVFYVEGGVEALYYMDLEELTESYSYTIATGQWRPGKNMRFRLNQSFRKKFPDVGMRESHSKDKDGYRTHLTYKMEDLPWYLPDTPPKPDPTSEQRGAAKNGL